MSTDYDDPDADTQNANRPIRNNRDRVYRTLERGLGNDIAEYAEHVLAKAGLIAPDLPEPRIELVKLQKWGKKHESSVSLEDGLVTVEILDDISRDLDLDEARDLAYELLAAVAYAERYKP